jgi:hypothetical protein
MKSSRKAYFRHLGIKNVLLLQRIEHLLYFFGSFDVSSPLHKIFPFLAHVVPVDEADAADAAPGAFSWSPFHALPTSMNHAWLYEAQYGPHGLETLLLAQTPDRAWFFGLKIRGDPNVPRGQLSFRVPIGAHPRAAMRYPLATPCRRCRRWAPLLTCVAVFGNAGGQTAQHGFLDPAWGAGELHVFQEGFFSFVWHDHNFEILYAPTQMRD